MQEQPRGHGKLAGAGQPGGEKPRGFTGTFSSVEGIIAFFFDLSVRAIEVDVAPVNVMYLAGGVA